MTDDTDAGGVDELLVAAGDWSTAGKTPFEALADLVDVTDSGFSRSTYVAAARREIPGASRLQAQHALDTILGEADPLPDPDPDVAALADRIDDHLREWGVPHDHVIVVPERRERTVSIRFMSRADVQFGTGPLWELGIAAREDGVTYNQNRHRYLIDVDAYGGVDQ